MKKKIIPYLSLAAGLSALPVVAETQQPVSRLESGHSSNEVELNLDIFDVSVFAEARADHGSEA